LVNSVTLIGLQGNTFTERGESHVVAVEELDKAQQASKIAVEAGKVLDNQDVHEAGFDVAVESLQFGPLERIARLAVVRVDANEFPAAMFHITLNPGRLGCHPFPVIGCTTHIGDDTRRARQASVSGVESPGGTVVLLRIKRCDLWHWLAPSCGYQDSSLSCG